MAQYALNLALKPVYARENLIISTCNAAAWQWLEAWPDWPASALYLTGPEGSGKSHMAHLWRMNANADSINANQLAHTEPQTGHWLIEDIDAATSPRSLLHWLNYIREHKGSLLLTSRHNIDALAFSLRDLTSRLKALTTAHIDQPDDGVLEGVLRKQWTDRQLPPDEDVIAFLLARMERSLPAIKHTMTRLDQAALAQQRPITIPFVKHVLGWG